ncbi:MAG: hypothetical protein IT434_09245 [Phycisphaerales bacterium]|jgi:hypothetical protein|nr:hypothetical protein [Phycisphaerales bacterium]
MRLVSCLAACVMTAMALPASAQEAKEPIETIGPDTTFTPEVDAAQREYAAAKKKIRVMEQELRKLRRAHFGTIKRVDIRQEGLAKLRTYTEPSIFASLIEIFRNDSEDVRTAVLDVFSDARSDSGDAALAWVSMTDRDAGIRAAALDRLQRRLAEVGGVSDRINLVVLRGLRSGDEKQMAAAAELAGNLGLYEVIPWLISAQVGQSPGRGGGGSSSNQGDLAYILVGQQIAFVSGLTPVVSDSAVAFDPQVSVAYDGTLLRVHDAAVTTYRTEVHNALVGLSSRYMGRPTVGMGWDQDKWWKWYQDEFLPLKKARAAEKTAAANALSPEKK